MSDKKMGPVQESIARLRELRYMTKGPGAKRARAPKPPSIEKLIATIAAIKPTKKKSRKGRR